MSKVIIRQREDDEIDAEEVLEKKVRPFGNNSAHLIVPRKWVGYTAIIAVKELAGPAMSDWGKEVKRRNKLGNKKSKEGKVYGSAISRMGVKMAKRQKELWKEEELVRQHNEGYIRKCRERGDKKEWV